jgi:hypothetical protein
MKDLVLMLCCCYTLQDWDEEERIGYERSKLSKQCDFR